MRANFKKVKKAIADADNTISGCARDIGIAQPNLSNAINGNIPMYPKYRRLLSEYLGIEEEVLFIEGYKS